MLLLLLPIALAKPHADQPSLLIPAVPTSGPVAPHYATFAPLPKGASISAPWTSDFAPVVCKADHDGVAISMEVQPSAWPYSLPPTVTCSQGDIKLAVRLGFRDPDVGMWRATDGTIVVPHRDGQFMQSTFDTPEPVASASVSPETVGVSCETNGRGVLVVKVNGDAKPGTAQCQAVLSSGGSLEQKVALIAY